MQKFSPDITNIKHLLPREMYHYLMTLPPLDKFAYLRVFPQNKVLLVHSNVNPLTENEIITLHQVLNKYTHKQKLMFTISFNDPFKSYSYQMSINGD